MMLNPIYLLAELWFCISGKKQNFYKNIAREIRLYTKLRACSKVPKKDLLLAQLVADEIYKISETPSKEVLYVFQNSFFDLTGERYYSGGAERYVCDLASIARLFDLKIVLIQCGDKTAKTPWIREKEGIKVIGVNSSVKRYTSIISALPEPKFAIYSGFVYWGNVFENSLIISHGITWDGYGRNCSLVEIKSILEKFKTVISVDTNTVSWFRSTFSKDLQEEAKKFIVIPNYVDLEKFYPVTKNNEAPLTILFPRRLCSERGFDLFYSICSRLLENFPNVRIDFVGFVHTDTIQQKLDVLMQSYEKRVSHQLVEADEMYKIYQNSDISVIPTLYSEGTSLSCLEAMASGNCVISTNVGGLPNLIISGYNGILVNPDQKELYDALVEVIVNHERRISLQKNALEVVKVFSKKEWEKSWMKIFKQEISK